MRAARAEVDSLPLHKGSLLGLGQLVAWGSLFYSFPIIAEQQIKNAGWDPVSVYAAATLSLVAAGLFAFPVGVLIDKGHGRAVVLTGSVLGGALLLFCSLMTEQWQFYLVYFFMGAAMAASLYEPVFATLVRSRPSKRASRLIIRTAIWGGFASTVYVPLFLAGIQLLGFRSALAVLGFSTAVLTPILHFFGIGKPGLALESERNSKAIEPKVSSAKNRLVLGEWRFWVITLVFSLHAALASAVSYHLYPYLLQTGFTLGEAVLIMNLVGPAQILGRLVPYWRLAGATRWRFQAAVVLLLPLALALALASGYGTKGGLAAMLIAATCYGAANGTITILKAQSAIEYLPHLPYGRTNGIMALPITLARSLGPLLTALFLQNTQAYRDLLGPAVLMGLGLPILFAVYASRRLTRS